MTYTVIRKWQNIPNEAYFFIILPIVYAILSGIVIIAFPRSITHNPLAIDPHDRSYITPFIYIFGIIGLLIGFLGYSSRALYNTKITKSQIVEKTVAFVLSLGFLNLITGTVYSFLGYIIPFALGILGWSIYKYAYAKKPFQIQSPKVIISIALFVLYCASSVLFSNNKSLSNEFFWRISWLVSIPLLFAIAPLDNKIITLFTRFALIIGYTYLLIILLLYLQACYASETPINVAFQLKKTFFVAPNGEPIYSSFLIESFGIHHYQFITFVLATPFFVSLIRYKNLYSSACYGISLVIFTHVLQVRFAILVIPSLTIIVLLLRYTAHKLQVILPVLLTIVVTASIISISFFALNKNDVRYKYLEVASQHYNENPIWGMGMGTSQMILFNAGYDVGHYHNSYIETYMELGIIGSLLLLIMLIAIFSDAIKRKNYEALILLTYILLLMFVEEIAFHTLYFFMVLFPLCVYSFRETPQKHLVGIFEKREVHVNTSLKKHDEK